MKVTIPMRGIGHREREREREHRHNGDDAQRNRKKEMRTRDEWMIHRAMRRTRARL